MSGSKPINIDDLKVYLQAGRIKNAAEGFSAPAEVPLDHEGMTTLTKLHELVAKTVSILKTMPDLVEEDCTQIREMVDDFVELDKRLSTFGFGGSSGSR